MTATRDRLDRRRYATCGPPVRLSFRAGGVAVAHFIFLVGVCNAICVGERFPGCIMPACLP